MHDYVIVEGKHLAGASLDRALRTVKYLTVSRQGEFHGFTTSRAVAEWAEGQGVGREHAEATQRLRSVRRRAKAMSASESRATRRHLVRRTEYHRAELEDQFAERKIDPHDIAQLNALARREDPILGPLLGCAILFDAPDYCGAWLYLTRIFHPDLSWYGWERRAASVWVPPALFGTPAAMFETAWYAAGLTLSLWFPVPDLGVFTGRAASAWTW